MQPAPAFSDPADLGTTVVTTMRQLGVASLPRNYEIFYEALTGANHELSLAVVSLPKRPAQGDLDRIGQRFFAHHHGHTIVDNARNIIATELESIAALLRDERSHLEKYGQVLNQTADGLQTRADPHSEFIGKIMRVMAVATSSTIEHQRQTANTLGDKSVELETVKSKLEEYKRLVDTDSLTQLANRRAFDRELSRLYDRRADVMLKSLILADIDGFKAINDRFGHPLGDKVIQGIAGALRSCVHPSAFVARTGGEEFAAVLEGASEDAATEVAERMRQAVQRTTFNTALGGDYLTVTLSVGVCMAAEAEGADELYAKADKALYRSKAAGRNRVTRHSQLDAASFAKSWMLYRKD